jgi:hypothetical protein
LVPPFRQPLPRDVTLVAAQINGRAIYPTFQFRFRDNTVVGVHDIVSRLHERLGGRDDPLGAISWWLTPNAWLGRPPSQLLGLGRDAEIEYGAEQLDNDNW